MLPFTRENLTISGQNIFYYDKNSMVLSVSAFSNQIFQDLNQYLGIQQEINNRKKMAEAINSEYDYLNKQLKIVQELYDKNKIQRIELLYDIYVDFVLKFMQILYYEQFQEKYIYRYDEEFYVAIQSSVNEIVDNLNYDLSQLDIEVAQKAPNNEEDDDHIKELEKKFLKTFRRFVNNLGLQLSKCFQQAIQKLQPLRNIIEQYINLEFPLKTYQDKIVEEQHLVVAKKKTKQ